MVIRSATLRAHPSLDVPTVETPAVAAARAYGIDIGMLVQRLRLTPAERLERHAQALALVRAFRRQPR